MTAKKAVFSGSNSSFMAVQSQAVRRARAVRHCYEDTGSLNGDAVAMCIKDSAKAVQARKAEIQILLAESGLSKSQSASWDQLARLLAHVASRKGPSGYETSDEDVKWLVTHATNISRGPSYSWQDFKDNSELQLELNYVAQVLPDYLSYLEHSGMIEEVFNRFDTDQSGFLEKDELKLGECACE